MVMKNNYFLFVIIILITLLLMIIFNYSLNITEITSNFYSEQLAQEQLDQFIESQEKWSWLGYVVIPLLILIRVSLVALCLSIGVFFYDTEIFVRFKEFFRVALVGEFVLVLVGCVKFFYFAFIRTDYTFKDIQQFYPFSYINFLDIEKIQPWLVYPLQTLNLFEVAYFFVLVYGVHKLLKNKYWKSFEITAISYGTGLLIWIALVMFLTLNIG